MGSRPAWSAPPSPCARIAPLVRVSCGALLCLSRVRCAAADPFFAAPRGGGGYPSRVRSACNAALSGRGLCAPWGKVACRCAMLPCCVWARKRAPLLRLSLLAAAPCCVWAQAVLRPFCPLLFCPLPLAAAARYRYNKVAYLYHAAPLPNWTKTAPKKTKSVKKRAFLCGTYCRKRPRVRQLTVR